jgi:DNA-binding transcriptional MerR regulator
MLIGELAESTGLSRDTIRYYEKEGLLNVAERRDNNYKEYAETAADQLRFIKALQDRGFTLGEIRELLAVSAEGPVTCGDVGARIREKVGAIDAQIAALEAMKARLQGSFECCRGNSQGDVCTPIAEMRMV